MVFQFMTIQRTTPRTRTTPHALPAVPFTVLPGFSIRQDAYGNAHKKGNITSTTRIVISTSTTTLNQHRSTAK